MHRLHNSKKSRVHLNSAFFIRDRGRKDHLDPRENRKLQEDQGVRGNQDHRDHQAPEANRDLRGCQAVLKNR